MKFHANSDESELLQNLFLPRIGYTNKLHEGEGSCQLIINNEITGRAGFREFCETKLQLSQDAGYYHRKFCDSHVHSHDHTQQNSYSISHLLGRVTIG